MKRQNQNQQALPGTVETPPSLQQPSPRERLLIRLSSHFPKDFTPEELTDWKRNLDNFSLEDLEFAVQKWIDGEHFFPKVADIRQIIACKHENERLAALGKTTYPHHGKGYGEADMKLLWKIFHEKYPEPIGRRLSADERHALIAELDERRKVEAA